MSQTDQHQSEVKAHYRELATEYGQRANQTCERKYHQLVHEFLKGKDRVLELGSGSSELLDSLESPTSVACDLSREMLLMRPGGDRTHRVVAVGERLPFADASFNGVFLINVLEHVTDLDRVIAESARMLEPGGIWLAVTPNGNWEGLLDLAERWKLKIPEGPHRFLTMKRLNEATARHLEVVKHRAMLALPAGPPALAALIDRVSFAPAWGGGFFQYLAARKR